MWMVFHPAGVAPCSILPRSVEAAEVAQLDYINDGRNNGEVGAASIDDADHRHPVSPASMASCADCCRSQTVPRGRKPIAPACSPGLNWLGRVGARAGRVTVDGAGGQEFVFCHLSN